MDVNDRKQLEAFAGRFANFTGIMCNMGAAALLQKNVMAQFLWERLTHPGWVEVDDYGLLRHISIVGAAGGSEIHPYGAYVLKHARPEEMTPTPLFDNGDSLNGDPRLSGFFLPIVLFLPVWGMAESKGPSKNRKITASENGIEAWIKALAGIYIVSGYRIPESEKDLFRMYIKFLIEELRLPQKPDEIEKLIALVRPTLEKGYDREKFLDTLDVNVWFIWFISRGHGSPLKTFMASVQKEGARAIERQQTLTQERVRFQKWYYALEEAGQAELREKEEDHLGFNALVMFTIIP